MQKNILKSLREAVAVYNDFQTQFRQVSEMSDELRRISKRVIFHVSKQDAAAAEQLLKEASKLLDDILGAVADEQILLDNEGYKAASEEFMEACLTYMILTGENFDLGRIRTTSTRRLGAFSDLCGELARLCVLLATDGKEKQIKDIRDFIQELLLELSKTKIVENSYLRSKYDQAEKALRKVEDILYQLTVFRQPAKH
jgi:predicted translin family RNA/ssDNA-binding protein